MKNKNLFFVLLCTAIFNSHGMEQQTSEQPTFQDYAEYIGNILLDNIPLNTKEFPSFPGLSPEIQNKIASLLLLEHNAETLEACGKTISLLARINKELNELINNPDFCLKLIKHFAMKFNCSDEEVAIALKILGAQKYLENHQKLHNMFASNTFDEYEFHVFYNVHKKYTDLNFTFLLNKGKPNQKIISLLLYAIAKDCSDNTAARTRCLLRTHAIDINYAPSDVPALVAALWEKNSEIVKLLCKYPGIDVNQAVEGLTPLMLCCMDEVINLEYISLLLDAGADPELPTPNGYTPLEAAQETEDETFINLIQNAINKKHEKK